jgi:hypothetical protein
MNSLQRLKLINKIQDLHPGLSELSIRDLVRNFLMTGKHLQSKTPMRHHRAFFILAAVWLKNTV